MTSNKRMLRSLGALALVLMMLLSMMACGQKPEPDTSKPVQSGDVSTDLSGSEDESDNSTVGGDDTTTGSDVSDDTTTGSDVSGDTTGTSGSTGAAGSTTSGTKKPTGNVRPSGTMAPGSTTKSPFATTTSTTKKTSTTTGTRTTVDFGSENDVLSKVPESLSKQKVKVLVWWPVGEGDKNHAKKFTDKTGISVVHESISADMYQTRLSAMIMGNNAPSCAAIISEWYPQPITRGLMQPIENTGWDFTEEIYATNLMEQFAYKGKYYGIALKGSTMTTFNVLMFNKDLLKQRGVTKDPYQLWKEGNWNWDTCLEIAQKCTDYAKGLSGISVHWQTYWMLSTGQDFVLNSKDGLVNNVTNPVILDAWTHAWHMINTYKVVDTTFTDKTPFLAGTAAMFATGSYLMQAEHEGYIPQAMKADWGVAPFPSPKGMDTVAGCEGTVWGFPSRIKDDKLQAAAWYIRYWLDDTQYGDPEFYSKDECWEVMNWMWNQKVQSFNSMGVFGYGGEYTAAGLQYEILGDGASISSLKSNLDSWYSVAEANIDKIESEMIG